MNAVQIFDVSWNSLSIINNKLAIWRTFQVIKAKQLQYDDKTNEVQQKSSVKSTKWYGVENLVLDNKREFLYCCFEEFLNERSVSLQNTQMNDFEIEVFSVCLKNNKTLIELNLSNCLIFDSNKTVGIVIEALKRNSTLRILNFSDNHIGDDGAKVLVKSITTNVVLQKLDLSNNEISDSGVSSFKDYLKINKKLQELNLSRNRITDKGAKSLAEGIQENTTLLELNVSKNLINKEGIMFLVEACAKNRALNKLVCTHNNLSKSELEVIIKYISETIAIQIFIASWNSVCTKFGKLAIKTTIQVIDVNSDDRNTQEDFWCVNEIKTLQHRKKFLFRCFESENSVIIHGSISMLEIELISDCLRTNKTLTDLTLSQAKFTDEELGKFMEAIKVNIMLQSIDISHNLITENGASIIINNIGKLRKLNISNNKINDEGAKRIAEAIQVNKTLQELNISKNFISKEGIFTILEACAQTRTLHKLVCTHNNLSNFGLKAINEYIIKMKAVKTFDASWNSISTKYGVLAIITTFQFLNVKQNLPADDHGIWKELWFLNEIQKVYRKDFLCCCFENDQLNNYLQGVMKTDSFKAEIINAINAHSDFDLCDGTADEEVYNNKANRLFENYSKEMMALSYFIKINNSLQYLNLSENGIYDREAQCIAQVIQANTTLIEVDISKNFIRKEGVMEIVKACTIHRTLQRLICTHNELSKDELVAINEYISKENTNALQIFDASWSSIMAELPENEFGTKTLTSFVFQSFKLHDGDWETELFNKESELYMVNSYRNLDSRNIQYSFTQDSLKELSFLPCKYFSNVFLYFMKDILQKVNTLQKLNISGNKISDDGAITFSKYLKTNKTLIELDISWNNISCSGTSAIANVMQANEALQKLDISHNEIFDDGAVALSECLAVNKTLVYLDVSWNNITCNGVNAFAKALKINNALQKLNISDNRIPDVLTFSECHSTLLTKFKMSQNDLHGGASSTGKAFQVNNALQKLNISAKTMLLLLLLLILSVLLLLFLCMVM